MRRVFYAALTVVIYLFCGCSSGNNGTTILNASGKHPSGWAAANTGGKHPAAYLAESGSCYECHGEDLMGGISNVSCFSASRSGISCHPGGPGVAHPIPYIDHGGPAQANMTSCLGCHQIAQNTTSPPGCMNCHLTSPQTNPNNCISCHQKPPGGTVYPNNAVSHAAHNSLNVPQNSTETAQCDQCHQGLGSGTLDHLNRSRSRSSSLLPGAVIFGTLAKTGGLVPVFNPATGSCALTYCHGNTLAGGTDKTPVWGTTLSGCGTCHGFPPPAPHSTSTSCSGCHPDVNATPTQHINGTVNATGGSAHATVYPGSAHSAAGAVRANCTPCHDTTTAGGIYPAVTPGAPPPCSGCHLNMTNFLGANPGCWDCHGASQTSGLPNGSTFPNRQGRHNLNVHEVACTFCHPLTAGDPSHGWSNRTKSTNAQVNSGLGWVPGSRSNSGTCATAGCHGTDESPWYP